VRDQAGVPTPSSLTIAVEQAHKAAIRERKPPSTLTHQQAPPGAHLLLLDSSVLHCIFLSLGHGRSCNSVPHSALRLGLAASPVAVLGRGLQERERRRMQTVGSLTNRHRPDVFTSVIPVAAGCLTVSSITCSPPCSLQPGPLLSLGRSGRPDGGGRANARG
jgi:hypothetical protein